MEDRPSADVREDAGTPAGTETMPWRADPSECAGTTVAPSRTTVPGVAPVSRGDDQWSESRARYSRAMRLSMGHYRFKKVTTFVQCLGSNLSIMVGGVGTGATGPEPSVWPSECSEYKWQFATNWSNRVFLTPFCGGTARNSSAVRGDRSETRADRASRARLPSRSGPKESRRDVRPHGTRL